MCFADRRPTGWTRRARTAVAAVLVLTGLLGCAGEPLPPEPSPSRSSQVSASLVLTQTLRRTGSSLAAACSAAISAHDTHGL
ncbi:hypothetical protein BAL199_13203 [alpha proteobacterium BAL199]|nr:hypothetical protein BAL199_13203 [alpha proteobacterium BAL199]